jgi:hypothetical protein
MNNPSAEGFQAAAEEFCAMARREESLTKSDLWCLRELLVRLIFHIPAVESCPHGADFDGKRLDDEEYARAVKRFSGLPFNFYRVVFDPHDLEANDEPVTGMLADDLADIYRDLAEGLDNARAGHIADACSDWSESYMSHWSRHAVNALASIEIYRTNNYERVEQGGRGNE